jgi:hypothetical protein
MRCVFPFVVFLFLADEVFATNIFFDTGECSKAAVGFPAQNFVGGLIEAKV